jgi:hypothetical protein
MAFRHLFDVWLFTVLICPKSTRAEILSSDHLIWSVGLTSFFVEDGGTQKHPEVAKRCHYSSWLPSVRIFFGNWIAITWFILMNPCFWWKFAPLMLDEDLHTPLNLKKNYCPAVAVVYEHWMLCKGLPIFHLPKQMVGWIEEVNFFSSIQQKCIIVSVVFDCCCWSVFLPKGLVLDGI